MKSNSPFINIDIFPSHAKRTAIVTWIVDSSIKDAEFYVYRKYDGGAEWELLNTSPVYGNTYADTDFVIKTKTQVPHYRLLAILNGKEYASPGVGVFDHVDRKAFGVAANIAKAKYLQARQDGIPVLYYPAVRNGKMTSTLDAITGQRTKAACTTENSIDPDDDDNNDYETYYQAGYYRPFMTYIRLMGEKLQQETRLDEGTFDEAVQNTEFLAFPPVRSGDLVVDAKTDKRWIVGDSIRADMIKGIIPVGYSAVLTLQAHNQSCYTVPIPSNYPVLLRRLLCHQR